MNTTAQNTFLECRGIRMRYEYDANKFGAGLYATARGYCPVSPAGFHSCPPIEIKGEADPRILIALMNDHAKQTDRERIASIRRAQHTLAKRPPETPWLEYVTLNSTAMDAFQMGIFATDADRAKLWQLAYLLYETVLDKPAHALPTCRSFKLRFPDCDIETSVITPTRYDFEALKKFMRGEVPTRADFGERMGPLSLNTYNDLPPRPNGEPVINAPAATTDFDFDITMNLHPDKNDKPSDTDKQPARTIECLSSTSSATVSTQLELF